MNTFKRKSLHAAVLAGLGAVGFAGTASAVNVAQDGLGSVLLYPYYTVRADGGGNSTAFYDTLISVVNTTTSFKAVKVRFLEGKRSAEVLDFNLFMSPRDVWTGAITRTSDGARLVSSDRSCVVPTGLFSTDPANTLNHFKNFVYAATPADGGGTTLDRTREGHFEMLEMAVFTAAAATAAALHNSAGTPANCAFFQNNDQTPANLGLVPPAGGLAGGASMINVQAGSDYSYDAVALTNWATNTQYSRAGSLTPNLGSGNVLTSTVFRADGSVVTSTWTTGLDAVSASLMQQNVINEFVLETGTSSGTDWVVTFPTKRYYADIPAPGPAFTPFTEIFGGDCEPIEFTYFDREEAGAAAADGDFSPSPGPSGASLCYEANVVSIRSGQGHNPSGDASGVLGSLNTTGINITDDLQNGWANLRFIGTNAVAGVGTGLNAPASIANLAYNANSGGNANGAAQQYLGLPVTGFMVRSFNNGTLTCAGASCQGNYGSAFTHNYEDSILPAP